MTRPPPTITCVECGGTAHLISYLPPEDEPQEESLAVAYRCADCMERFDLYWEPDED